MGSNDKQTSLNFNVVFVISAVFITIFAIWGALAPNSLAKNSTLVFDLTTRLFGWFYLLTTFIIVFFCFYLAFSPFGKIRLGKDNSKPDFSFFTWIGMLFSAGFGVGLVFWGVAEPMDHFMAPPLQLEPQSVEAARMAIRYSMFHWGVHQWSIFTLVGLVFGYFQYRLGERGLVSSTLKPLLGQDDQPWWQVPVDILAVVATVFGVATSLGLGIMQINGGLTYVFNFPNTVFVQLMIIGFLLSMYLLSSTTGLNKGIKILSNLNLVLALTLMAFVLFIGPTVFILNNFTTGLGGYLQNFIKMSLRLTPFTGGTWVRDWTVFYWAWAIAWSPFVGSFIARVSRGRTIREFVLGVLLVPPLVAIFWMAVFGGTALHLEIFRGIPIGTAVTQDVSTALFVLLANFPLGFVFSILAILLILTFLITSADSATFVLGIMTSDGNLNPPMAIKIIWGVLQALIATVLLLSSGLQGLQTASLVAALPFTFIIILMAASLLKSLQSEGKQQNYSRK